MHHVVLVVLEERHLLFLLCQLDQVLGVRGVQELQLEHVIPGRFKLLVLSLLPTPIGHMSAFQQLVVPAEILLLLGVELQAKTPWLREFDQAHRERLDHAITLAENLLPANVLAVQNRGLEWVDHQQ
jgi:hypothetical protein